MGGLDDGWIFTSSFVTCKDCTGYFGANKQSAEDVGEIKEGNWKTLLV